MKPGGGKQKGSSFEREISRFLTLWCSGQTEKLHFWRSPGSGSVATVSRHVNVSGDIVSLTPEADIVTNLFNIELKNGYKDINFFQYFKKTSFKLETFWKQCCRDAKEAGKQPMLIYRQPPTIVGIGSFLDVQIAHMTLEFEDLEELKLYEMKSFFEVVSYDYVVQLWEHEQLIRSAA